MKKLLLFLMLLSASYASAQDVIVKKDGSTIVCRVVELTSTEIVYKKWSDLNGSNYVMNRADASAINYENGKKINLSEVTNLYTPNNQSDGTQQFNDKALLAMDFAAQNKHKTKKLRTWGWISGIAGVGIVTGMIIRSQDPLNLKHPELFYIGGGILAAGGIACSTYCFVTAHKRQKLADSYLQSYSLFQQNFKFENGSTLSTGIDMLQDRAMNSNTIGLGLRYNF